MRRKFGPFLLTAASVLAWAACSSTPDDRPQPKPAAAAQAHAPEPSDTGETGETGGTDEWVAIANDDDDVIEIDSPAGKRELNVVPVKSITPTPASVAWREVASFTEDLELIYVASGVVARSRSGAYELDGDTLGLRPELTLPNTPLLGHWPHDVWTLDGQASGPDYGVLRLDGDRRWVPQPYKGQARWTGELAVRKGWQAGLLVRDGPNLTRLGSRKEAPKVGLRMGKTVLDTIETVSGRLYNVSLRSTGIYVQLGCFNRSCVDENAKKLPFGDEWTFGTQVPRQRNSVSVLAAVRYQGTVAHQVLHYETGGWSLESLVHAPSGLWPAPNGGLWLLVRAELWYRTPQGQWYAMALPKGVGKISAALRFDADELWVATRVGGKTVVFATGASVVDLPAAG